MVGVLAKRYRDVEAIRGYFKSQNDGDEFNRTDQHHQSQSGECDKHKELCLISILQFFLFGKHEENETESIGDEYLEDLGKEIDTIRPEEERTSLPHREDGHDENQEGE